MPLFLEENGFIRMMFFSVVCEQVEAGWGRFEWVIRSYPEKLFNSFIRRWEKASVLKSFS